MQKNVIVGNAGFDVEAMSALSQQEFIDLHKGNADMKYGKTEPQFKQFLKDAYTAVQNAAKPLVTEKPKKAIDQDGGTDKASPGSK